jgi:hypothetical protein
VVWSIVVRLLTWRFMATVTIGRDDVGAVVMRIRVFQFVDRLAGKDEVRVAELARRVVLLGPRVGPLLVPPLEVVEGLGRVRHVPPLHVGRRVERPVVGALDVVRVPELAVVLFLLSSVSASWWRWRRFRGPTRRWRREGRLHMPLLIAIVIERRRLILKRLLIVRE